jgi:hypothetical protein|tara:strand:+ start:188 stop:520 length:333 start_codon:yes stop_codon:yes gene_type:complete
MQPYTLVQGDSAPQIKAIITRDDDDSVVDLSGGIVRLRFRKTGTVNVLFTIIATNTGTNFANGIAIFSFNNDNLATLSQGFYEGEIEIEYDTGTKETIYQVLEFYLRADF